MERDTPTQDSSGTATAAGPGADGTPTISSRVVAAGLLGTLVEHFDFAIYGYLATTLAVVFFASGTDPTAALLATFATFAAAFVLRPLGGLIFGHVGDRFGRPRALALTVLLMCLATAAIGVLPGYAAIGIGATLLLVTFRCVQGISAGGEIGGAAAFVAEQSPPARRGFFCSTIQIGALGGTLLASLSATVLTSVLTAGQVEAWGWRILFLMSVPLGLVGLWIRLRLEDSAHFRAASAEGQLVSAPAVELVRSHLPGLLRTLGVSTLLFAGYYIVYVYSATHLQQVAGLSASDANWSTTVTLAVSIALLPVFGGLSDRWGRRPLVIGASVAMLVLALPCFALMNAGGPAALVAHVVLGIPEAALAAVAFSTLAEQFSVRVRYSGIALGYNLTGMAVGGTAPLISVWLLDITGSPISPAWYLMVASLITIGTGLTLRETADTVLRR